MQRDTRGGEPDSDEDRRYEAIKKGSDNRRGYKTEVIFN